MPSHGPGATPHLAFRSVNVARFFFAGGAALLEDPATGSACANLGVWFCATRPGTDVTRVVTQGDEIGRPSALFLAVAAGAVTVGGDVLALASGAISL